jgi:hypothetical protein
MIEYRQTFMVERRLGAMPWEPAITGTLNQTGASDEDASTFWNSDQAHEALTIAQEEMGSSWELRVREFADEVIS